MKLWILILLFFTSCTTKPKLENLEKKYCGEDFCAYQIGLDPKHSLVYFPGLLDSKKALEKSVFDTSDIDAIIQEMKPVQVLVYSKSKPNSLAWFIKSPDRINEVIKMLPGPVSAIGISMGGYNLASYSLMNPGAFTKVVLVNPMLLRSDESPFTTITGPALLLKGHYQKAEWAKLDPYSLISSATTYPKTLISSCKKDLFNLMPGAISFYGAMKVKGFDVKFQEAKVDCKHTDIPTNEIVEFLK